MLGGEEQCQFTELLPPVGNESKVVPEELRQKQRSKGVRKWRMCQWKFKGGRR